MPVIQIAKHKELFCGLFRWIAMEVWRKHQKKFKCAILPTLYIKTKTQKIRRAKKAAQ